MEPKKNKKYQLDQHYPLHFTIGLAITMAFVIIAFEWKSEIEPMNFTPQEEMIIDYYLPPLTDHERPEPPKPVKTQVIEKQQVNLPPVFVESDEPEATKAMENPIPDMETFITDPSYAVEEEPDFYEGIVESMPEFEGGETAFLAYLSEHIKYPRSAINNGVEGTVYLRYIIDTDGSITDIEVMRGLGFGCDEEAIRVLKLAPRWTPGKQRGRPVKFRMIVPIRFNLQ